MSLYRGLLPLWRPRRCCRERGLASSAGGARKRTGWQGITGHLPGGVALPPGDDPAHGMLLPTPMPACHAGSSWLTCSNLSSCGPCYSVLRQCNPSQSVPVMWSGQSAGLHRMAASELSWQDCQGADGCFCVQQGTATPATYAARPNSRPLSWLGASPSCPSGTRTCTSPPTSAG